MGRPARRGDPLPVPGQGSLLGFLTRAPLVVANDNTNSRTDDEPENARCDATKSSVDSTSVHSTGEADSSVDEDVRATVVSQKPPLRMADSLERIARATQRWCLLFTKLEQTTVDQPKRDAVYAARDAAAFAALANCAYAYRTSRYQACVRRSLGAGDDEEMSDDDRDVTTQESESDMITKNSKRRRHKNHHPSWSACVRDARLGDGQGERRVSVAGAQRDAFAMALSATRELGVTHLPRPRHDTNVIAAYGDPVVSAVFDAKCQRLVSATASGGLCLLRVDTLRLSNGERFEPLWVRNGLGDSGSVTRTLSSVAWGGEDGADGGGCIATASGDADAVEILDASVGRQVRLVTTSSTSSSSRGFGATGTLRSEGNSGLLDVSFVPGTSGNTFVASGKRGKVFLWDARCANGPRATLSSPGAGKGATAAVHCVRLSSCGQTLLAGTGFGEVHLWDLRGGGGGGDVSVGKRAQTAFSVASRRETSFPVLKTWAVSDMLAQTNACLTRRRFDSSGGVAGGLRSAVHWCEFDPCDSRRFAFHLANGWSGCADASCGRAESPIITHAHCPPPPFVPGTDGGAATLAPGLCRAALAHRRTAAWLTIGAGGTRCATLVVGIAGAAGVRVLDFAPSPSARHWVHGVDEDTMEAEDLFEQKQYSTQSQGDARCRGSRGRFWRDEIVETSGPAIAVAADTSNPGSFVLGTWNAMSWCG